MNRRFASRTGRGNGFLVVAVTALALLALAAPANAAFPGANGKIAFASGRGDLYGRHEIFTVNPDGTDLVKITSNSASGSFDDDPVWSRDGRTIAFVHADESGEGTGSFIYLMNADGTGIRKLPNTGFNAVDPTWSPDGARIAFANAPGPQAPCVPECAGRSIYSIKVDGTGLTRLTQNSRDDEQPAWSPDGSQIAFSGSRDPAVHGTPEIYVMNADGTNPTQLTVAQDDAGDHHPNWSPDGKRIVFSSGNIWVVNADGTGRTRVTTDRARNIMPAWSPDGSRIAYTSDISGDAYNIFTVNVDGTDPTRGTSDVAGAQDLEPDWQPLNRPPDCSHVSASPDTLWPPNRKLVPVSLSGATDPDGDQVTLTITGVSQDEPTGNSPSAVLGPTSNDVSLRAERDGAGDGRVYRIAFKATDGRGGECSGMATVGVPHNPGLVAVDSAPPSYNSLGH